jgi:hypothetical protein
MNNNLMVALIHVIINLIDFVVSFSVLGINLYDIPSDKTIITVSLIIVIRAVRSQNLKILYIKYLNSLPLDQLEYLILDDIMLFP